MVTEDEHKIANSIRKGLEQEAFAVDVAYDGESGYDLAASEEFAVIVLDLMLPGMDGLTVCKKLREEGNHTPILVLTARGELDEKVVGLDSGADDYLVKPFAFAELVARIHALCRRPKAKLPQVLSYQGLSLNPVNYEVSRNQKSITLTRKEFALLEYLLHHVGRIVTKDQIVSHVWSYESDILPNTVEVYIGYLRQKIDKPFCRLPGLIQTVRGFGYKLQ